MTLPPIFYSRLSKSAHVGRFEITITRESRRLWRWAITAPATRLATGDVLLPYVSEFHHCATEDAARRAVRARLIDIALDALSRGLA